MSFENIPSYAWKNPVANFAALPTMGNSDGDARVTLDTDDIYIWNQTGQTWVLAAGPSAGGISSLNGQTGSSQSFATGTSGTDFNISSSGNVHTFNIPSSSALNRGLLTASDYSAFSAKPAGSGVSGEMTFWSGVNTLNSDPELLWDDVNKVVGIGPVGTIPFCAITTSRVDTNAAITAGANFNASQSVTANTSGVIVGVTGQATAIIDSGVTLTQGILGINFQALREDAADAGEVAALVGARVFARQQGVASGALTDNMIGLWAELIATDGTVNTMTDIFVASGTLTGSTVNNRFGLFVSPDDIGTKQNFLSGYSQIGQSFTSQHISAQLQIEWNPGDVRGLLGPRGTEAERDTIAAPPDSAGNYFFNLDTGQPNWFDGSNWIGLGSGSGDVTGPSSSVDNGIVTFDGLTGKIVKGSNLSLVQEGPSRWGFFDPDGANDYVFLIERGGYGQFYLLKGLAAGEDFTSASITNLYGNAGITFVDAYSGGPIVATNSITVSPDTSHISWIFSDGVNVTNASLVPYADATFDLGGAGFAFNDIYLSQVQAPNADILTFTNGPSGTAGNPDTYVKVIIGGTTYAIPAFALP